MLQIIDLKAEKVVEVVESEYVWHCPDSKCKKKGTILMKTHEPYLGGNGKMRCPECGEEHCFCDIMKSNKRNLEKFLKNL